jgi:hypothetical protein
MFMDSRIECFSSYLKQNIKVSTTNSINNSSFAISICSSSDIFQNLFQKYLFDSKRNWVDPLMLFLVCLSHSFNFYEQKIVWRKKESIVYQESNLIRKMWMFEVLNLKDWTDSGSKMRKFIFTKKRWFSNYLK